MFLLNVHASSLIQLPVAPLPQFEGDQSQAQAQAQSQPAPPQQAAPPASPQPTGLPPVRVPALGPDKVAQYSSFFDKSGAQNGMLDGASAKQIFEEAGLPNEVLGRIWGLSDTQGRGSLNVTEFVTAMHLLASYKSGAMRGVPTTLPPGLHEAASRRPPARVGSGSRPSSSAFASPSIPPQFSGARGRPQSPITRQQVSTPLSNQSTGEQWLVSAADKAKFDNIFSGIDRSGSGYLNGEQAVGFFGNAGLPEEVLAQIWDLADIRSEGRLNKEEFAVAMYLIRQQRGSRDGRGILPSTLPQALVPPSMRKQHLPPSQPTAPSFENAPVTKPRSAADDLFGLDAFGPPAQQQIPQGTGSTDAGPFANPPSQAPTSSPVVASNTFRPFVPSSSFGQSLSGPQSGSPSPNQTRSMPSAADDLLGDTDPTESSRLTNETSELANLSNQVTGLSRQMGEVQSTRGQTEQELSQQSAQKRAFESRLSQLRALYEKEVKEVKALKDQLSTSRNDTKRLQQDMAVIDGSHQDLSTQHQQLRQALETDQRENTALKERIRQMNAEVDQLKPQLEKLKSDARQQKGLVAINKKQLATNEAERDRLTAEITAAQKEIEDAAREAEASAQQAEATAREVKQAEETAKEVREAAQQAEASKRALEEARSVPVPVKSPPAVATPAPSTSSNNPFFRRTTEDAARSPDAPVDNRNTFDSIFGPSFGPPTGAPAPTTSFKAESPDAATPPSVHRLDDSRATSYTTPQIQEPPPPSSANQITSSSLPFRTPLARDDSVSSSVRVAPPASRLSPVDTPRTLTPSNATSTPPASKQTEDPFAPSAQDEEQESVRDTIPTGEQSADEVFGKATEDLSPIPGAFPGGETPRAEFPPPSSDRSGLFTGADVAAVDAGAGSGVASGMIGEDKGKAPEKPKEEGKAMFDEYFGGPAHQRTPSEQAKDFDSAFASMKKDAPANGTGQASSQEFPDIQEIDDDDTSESEDESPMRFDDNFSSPQKSAPPEATPTEKAQEPASALPSHLQPPRPALESVPSTASSLPGFEPQQSPPTYQAAVPEDNTNHFPREYKNLLPERDNTTPPPAAGSVSNPPPSYGPERGHAQNQDDDDDAQPPTLPPKSSPFDFDSAFAGVGPAQVEEDSDEDDDAYRSSRGQAPEFDPSFDTPEQSRSSTAASNLPPIAQANGSPQPPPKDDFFGFNATQQGPSAASAGAPAAGSAPSHDWDDIFSGLSSENAGVKTGFDDDVHAPQVRSPPLTSPIDAAPNALTQTTSIGPDVSAFTTAQPVEDSKDPSPAPPEPSTPTQAQHSAPAITTTSPQTPTGSAKRSSPGPERPALGRAISTTSEHDDPILKRLTAMGWGRAESLTALEKFDYNIDKVSHYLSPDPGRVRETVFRGLANAESRLLITSPSHRRC